MDSSLFKHVRKGAVAAVLGGVVWMGIAGLGRSLWLDEAWVANSLRSSTWSEMWWGGAWLQTSPPLFLAVARSWLALGGLSTETLRSLSLVFALLTAGAMMAATAAAGAKRLAPLAAAGVLFAGVGPEYFFSFKQFGCEAAAVAVVLWAAAKNTRWLWLVASLLLPFAYPVAFLLPGLVFLVWHREGLPAAVRFTTVSGAVLGVLYFGFIRPNVEPSLWSYWGGSAGEAYEPGMVAWTLTSLALTVYAAWRRNFLLLASALPCLLLAGVGMTGWYPASPRMRLFVRPCFVFAVMMLVNRWLRATWVDWTATGAAVVWTVVAVAGFQKAPFEDYPAAFAELRRSAGPGDLILVHADAQQGWLWEAAVEHDDRLVKFGGTGWPCCGRGRFVESSTETSVRNDLERMIPSGYRGRVWLIYANRPQHWKYLGLDEGDLWRRTVWARGCPPGEYKDVGNLVVSPMDCNSH